MFGCDMLSILMQGDAEGDYLMGYADMISVKSAYLLALANNGMAAHIAYMTILSKEKGAWKIVQGDFIKNQKDSIDRIKKQQADCLGPSYLPSIKTNV